MKNLISNIRLLVQSIVNPVYVLVYTAHKNDETKSYFISSPKMKNLFSNWTLNLHQCGFRCVCYNRQGNVRAFRFDRVEHLAPLGILESFRIRKGHS